MYKGCSSIRHRIRERQLYENNMTLALNAQSKHAPMIERESYFDAVKTIRDLRQKDDQKANSPILPSQ